jgi:hypothetical protein
MIFRHSLEFGLAVETRPSASAFSVPTRMAIRIFWRSRGCRLSSPSYSMLTSIGPRSLSNYCYH